MSFLKRARRFLIGDSAEYRALSAKIEQIHEEAAECKLSVDATMLQVLSRMELEAEINEKTRRDVARLIAKEQQTAAKVKNLDKRVSRWEKRQTGTYLLDVVAGRRDFTGLDDLDKNH